MNLRIVAGVVASTMMLTIAVAPPALSATGGAVYSITADVSTPTMILYWHDSDYTYVTATPPWTMTNPRPPHGVYAYPTGYVWPHYTCTITIDGVLAAHNSGVGGVACTV